MLNVGRENLLINKVLFGMPILFEMWVELSRFSTILRGKMGDLRLRATTVACSPK
jgi:hypothetical protein